MKRITSCLLAMAALLMAAGCQPKTNTAKIEAMRKQVEANAKTLNQIETGTFATLERDFGVCDSMLQYMSSDEVNQVFPKLQLAGAYIEQFKATSPMMKADIDTTLMQLSNLKADAESHYLSDSLVSLYIEDEAKHVERIGNQVEYFKNRLGSARKDLDDLKKKAAKR